MNVLIVKTSAIGDVIQSFDALEYLKHRFPDAAVDWVVSPDTLELVSSHPLVRRAICSDVKGSLKKNDFTLLKGFYKDLRRQSYDILFDLQGNTKSGIISSLCRAKHKVGFGPQAVAEWPNLLCSTFQYNVRKDINIREQYVQLMKEYFKDDGIFEAKGRLLNIDRLHSKQIDLILSDQKIKGTLKILVCPSSRWKNKMLSSGILINFLNKIAEKANISSLFLWGDEEEKKIADLLHFSFKKNSIVLDRLGLPMLQNLMSKLDLVIAMDSFALHLSAGVDTPSFGIFGPTLSTIYNPLKENSIAFQGKCPFDRKFEKKCPILRLCPSPRCMQEINPSELYHYLSKLNLF